MPQPHIIAHRGYQLRFPENTLVAIRAAVECAARFVEFDVHLTSDRVPVLLHDESLERMCGVSRLIHEVSSEETLEFRAHEHERLGNQFASEPLATLKQCCDYLLTKPDVRMFVELKEPSVRHFGEQFVVESVLDILQPVLDRCVIISFSTTLLHEVARQTDCNVGPVIGDWSRRDVIEEFDKRPYVLFCDIAGLPRTGKLNLDKTHVAVYEVPDATTAMKLAERGVDYVETFKACEMLTDLKAFTKNFA